MNEVELKESGSSIVEQSQELIIFSPEENDHANGLLRAIMTGKKNIKAFWKDPKEKAYQAHKAISARETEMLKPITMAEQRIKEKISEYVTNERIKREAEEKRIREANEKVAEKAKEEGKEPEFIPEVKAPKEEKPQGQILKDLWSAEVIEKDFHLLPDRYKLPNMQMLNGIARAEKEKASIPGVKFIKTTNVSTRL